MSLTKTPAKAERDALPAAVLVTDAGELAALCDRLRGEPWITIDTEFMRERTYYPELCVVQLAGSADVAVVDAQAPGMDLAPLGALLADKGVLKVFHAARQDIEIFLELFGAVPTPLFDTQVAAMVAGFGDQVGYDALVAALTGGHIDKAHRFSDWSARPLSTSQIAYAAADVTHLRGVYESLRTRLQRDKRVEWVAQEMAVLDDPATYRPDPDSIWGAAAAQNRQSPHAGPAARHRSLAGAGGAAREHPATAPAEGRKPARNRRHRAQGPRGPGPGARDHPRLRRGPQRDRPVVGPERRRGTSR